MRISYVRVFVSDWERAVRFYTETLELPVTLRDDGMRWCQFATGEASLAIEASDPDEDGGTAGRFIGVSLTVQDIDGEYRALLSRGVEFLGPPERQPWRGTLAHFKYPDGNVLTLLSQAVGSRRGEGSVCDYPDDEKRH